MRYSQFNIIISLNSLITIVYLGFWAIKITQTHIILLEKIVCRTYCPDRQIRPDHLLILCFIFGSLAHPTDSSSHLGPDPTGADRSGSPMVVFSKFFFIWKGQINGFKLLYLIYRSKLK